MTDEKLNQAQTLNAQKLAVTDVITNINQGMDIIISCGGDKKLTLSTTSIDSGDIDKAIAGSRNAIITIIKSYQDRLNELFTNL